MRKILEQDRIHPGIRERIANYRSEIVREVEAAVAANAILVVGMKQNEKYDEKKVAERHRDHSWFIVFAPVEKPRIAAAIIVENGGFGARAAAPIARTMLDYYLLGKVPQGLDLQTPDDEVEDDRESD